MADGYARAGGRPGVAMVVPGVGVYNAASGLATAYACSSPVLLIAGQVNRAGIGTRPRPAARSARPARRRAPDHQVGAARVLDPAEIPGAVREAFHVHDERPPPPGGDRDPAGDVRRDRRRSTLLAPIAARVAGASTSKRSSGPPRLLAAAQLAADRRRRRRRARRRHRGVHRGRRAAAGAGDHDPRGQGRDRRPPPAVGRHDVGEPPPASRARRRRRRARGRHPVPGLRALQAGQQLIQIDVDPDQIGRNRPVDVAVAGDARPRSWRSARHRSRRPRRVARRRGRERDARDGRGRSSARSARRPRWSKRCAPAFPTTASSCATPPPSPTCATCTTRCTSRGPTCRRRTWARSASAFPPRSAPRSARPDRPVVAVVGDGGFLFTSNELATAMQHGIHTVTVVFDDGAYGNSNRDQREKFGGRELGTALQQPRLGDARPHVRRRRHGRRRRRQAARGDGRRDRSDHRGVGHLDGDRGADGSSPVTLLIAECGVLAASRSAALRSDSLPSVVLKCRRAVHQASSRTGGRRW